MSRVIYYYLKNIDLPSEFKIAPGQEGKDFSIESFYKQHKDKLCFHREDGPAIYESFFYSENEKIDFRMLWVKDNVIHRDDGPAFIEKEILYSRAEKISHEVWYQHGLIHRDDGPAEIVFSAIGIRTESWYSYGKIHRDKDEPSVFVYFNHEGDELEYKKYYKEGKIHRDHAPAVIEYDDSGEWIISEQWWQNGLIHREDGPARINYGVHHKVISSFWFIEGILVGKK